MSDQRGRKGNSKKRDPKKVKERLKQYGHQYLIMEGATLTHDEKIKVHVEKTKLQFDNLRGLKRRCDALLKANKSSPDKRYLPILDELLRQKRKYSNLVIKTTINLVDMKKFLTEVEENVLARKKKLAIQAGKEPTEDFLMRFHGRIATAQTKTNNALCRNLKKRNYVDDMMKERREFKKLLERVLRHLNAGKKVMVDLLQQALAAFDNRDETMNLTLVQRRTNEEKLPKVYAEADDAYKIVNQGVISHLFTTIKCRMRESGLDENEEEKYINEVVDTVFTIRDHTKLMSIIASFVEEEDVNAMCSYFKRQQGEKLTLFNYTNDASCEVEFLIKNTQSMRDECSDDLTIKGQIYFEQMDVLLDLDYELRYHSERMFDMQEKQVFISMFVAHSLEGLTMLYNNSLFASPLPDLFGEREVNYLNFEGFLKISETRIIFLISCTIYLENKIFESYLPNGERLLAERYPRRLPPFITNPSLPLLLKSITLCPFCVRHQKLRPGYKRKDIENRRDAEYFLWQLLVAKDLTKTWHSYSECGLPLVMEMKRQSFIERYLNKNP